MAEKKLDCDVKSRERTEETIRCAEEVRKRGTKNENRASKSCATSDGLVKGAQSESSAKRISVVSILVFKRENAEKVNGILSNYGEYVIGRMGIPYREKGVSVLSVALDAPVEVTNALTGKLGKVDGVSVKALFGKI